MLIRRYINALPRKATVYNMNPRNLREKMNRCIKTYIEIIFFYLAVDTVFLISVDCLGQVSTRLINKLVL